MIIYSASRNGLFYFFYYYEVTRLRFFYKQRVYGYICRWPNDGEIAETDSVFIVFYSDYL